MQTHLATALTEIIERSFDGNRTEFSKKCSVVYTTIHRICAGDASPTLDKLNDICQVLQFSDRKQLLLAAARDRIPAKYQDEIFGSADAASDMIRAKLPPDLAVVIRYLESTAMSDTLTADYLRRIGRWVGITEAPPQKELVSLVADAADLPTTELPERKSVTYPRATRQQRQ